MKFPKINTKSPVFISFITVCIILSILFIFRNNLKKIFFTSSTQIATVFNAYGNGSGEWTDTRTWGLNGGLTAMSGPNGVLISSTGEIYVADENNKRVVVLNSDGTASTTYSVAPRNATAIAISSSTGEIYVLDAGDDCNPFVTILNSDGSASTTYTSIDSYCPQGIAVSADGTIYIPDNGNGGVDVLNPDGTASTTYSVSGNPQSIVIAPSGEFYVATMNGSGVVVLNRDGTASTTYTSVPNPWGIGISPITSEIYLLSGSVTNTLYVLNPDGTASTSYVVGFNYPFGNIGISQEGNIYVADIGNSNVALVNPDGTASTTLNGTQLPPSFVPVEGVDYPGINNDVSLNAGITTLSDDQSVRNILLQSGATLDLNGHTLHVSGDWINRGATFISDGGTVDFTSTSTVQKILGANTFENLTKLSSSTASLLFDSEQLTTITGNFILEGSPDQLLSIGPSTGSVAPIYNSKFGNGKSGFYYPQSIVFSPYGDMYVADYVNHRISVLNPDGTASTSYDGGVFAPINPYGVARSSSGNLYIPDITHARIVVLNPDGTASTTYDAGVIGPINPTGVAISPITNEIYISSSEDPSRIVVLNPDGTASTSYNGGTLAPILFPNGPVTFSPTGEFYLADTYNNRIDVFNPDGTASTSYSTGLGLYIPIGTALDSYGNIYVTDYGNNRIVVLNPDGTASTTFDGADSGAAFDHPFAITVKSTGEIYVTDYRQRVIVFNADHTASTTYNNEIEGGFFAPYGITNDQQGNFYVADQSLNNIQKFNSSGNFLNKFNTSGVAGLTSVRSIEVDIIGNVYVNDNNSNNIIFKFNSDGDFIASSTIGQYLYDPILVDSYGNIYGSAYIDGIGTPLLKIDQNFNILIAATTTNGVAMNPGGMTLDQTGNFIYVFNTANYTIVKLNTADFSYVSSVSTDILGVGQLYLSNMVTDQNGNIFGVTNSYGFAKFSPELEYMTSVSSNGSNNGQFQTAKQLIVDSEGSVYVTDTNRGDIQKFIQSPFTPFNILATGTTTFSYISVSGSNNTGPNLLRCLDFCVNGGSNTGWLFPQIRRSYRAPATTTPDLLNLPIGTTTIPLDTDVEVATSTLPITENDLEEPSLIITDTFFTEDLQTSDWSDQVKLLQQFLNTHGFTVSLVGAGSVGYETRYFGERTKQALIQFQEFYMDDILKPLGLTKGTGYFGSYSRAKANQIILEE